MKRTVTVAVGLAVGSLSFAGEWFAGVDEIGYTGSITRHATLADANANVNVIGGPHAIPQRDGYVSAANATTNPAFFPTSFLVGTAWYYTIEDNTNGKPKDDPDGDRYYSGWANPNNTNVGFVQMFDDDASTVSSMLGQWTDLTYSTYTLFGTGTNSGVAESARLWDAPGPNGFPQNTAGIFRSWTLNMTFTGLSGTPSGGLIVHTGTIGGVTGSFTGVFENTSTTNVGANGFYRFTLNYNMTSWVKAQGNAALNGDLLESVIGAEAVPEPASMTALGLAALALLRRRKSASV